VDSGSVTPEIELAGTGPVEFLKSVTGNRLVLTPRAVLAHGTRYTLTLHTTLRDAAGNTLPQRFQASFTTAAGITFQPYLNFPVAAYVSGLDMGDVNGDDRRDLVMTTASSYLLAETDADTLFIFHKGADGKLAAPQRLRISDSVTCHASSAQVGDVTGDGQNDIVISNSGCGIMVYQRTANGDWPRPQRIDNRDSSRIALADMNHDNRLDVVGFSHGGDTVTIWYQLPEGGLAAATSYPISHPYLGTPTLGDINHDGRTDIVFTSSNGLTATSIATTTQAASGGFNVPVYYGTPSGTLPYSHAAIGDVNNDGRNDLVMSLTNARIGVLLQLADGTLGPITLRSSFLSSSGVSIQDINKDGLNDIVVSYPEHYGACGIFYQKTGGVFDVEDMYNQPGIPIDANDDGLMDLLQYTPSGISIFTGSGLP